MKKTLLLLASVALLLAGCAKEQIAVSENEGGLVNATFTASLDSGVATKAAVDGDGAAASVNRCIMEIYYGDELYARQYAKVTDKKSTFTAQMVSNRKYTVAFWADCVADTTTKAGLATDKYYTTTSLKTIALKGSYIGNDDARDAFFHVKEYTVVQAGSSFGGENDKILLKRPFAQMNVITTDWDKANKVTGLSPEKVKVTLKNALVNFNAVTGEASGSQTLTYEAAVYTAPDPVDPVSTTEKTLSMDYLFASTTKGVIDIDWKALHGTDANVEHAFAAVPYQRNYRTNIKGKLLTTQGQWTVTVDSDWTGKGTTVEGGEDPYLVNYFATGSIAAANEALKTNNAVSIENPSDLGTDIVIPTEQDGKNVLIKITGATEGNIVIKNENDGAANLKLESDSKNLTINTPKSHVDLDKGDYEGVTATTSATTLVVGKDVEIETLTINGGNAEIYGLVNTISRASGVIANWYADSREKLIAGLDKSVAGESVVLTSDIDLDNVEWAPVTIGKAITFDGGNHTIKNLKIAETHPDSHYGFIGYLYSNGVVKNLTINGAEILLPESKGDNSRGAALVGIARDGDIINCHVKNVTVKAYQKVGGLIGQYSLEASGTSIVKDCSSENVTISENQTGEGVWGAGGLIGSLCLVNNNHNITVDGCSVEGITITNSTSVAKPKQTAHAFIGTIRDDAEAVISLTNNTVEQATGLYTDMYSSDYFGWATNNESNPSHKCNIIIDGTPWTPNYPYQIAETGAKYSTLANALTAATAGQTVQILKDGDYTFPGNTKKAITIEGLDEKGADGNYVAAINLNGVSEYNENLTFKHLTFNFTNSEGSDRGFTHCVNMTYNECVFTGLMWGYDSQVSTFNDCLFHQATKYNVWSYGGNLEFNRCLFQTSTGTIVNVYATGTDVHEVRFNDCTFESLNDVLDKGAILLKGGNNHGHVIVNNYTLKGKFQNNGDSAKYINSADGLYMFSLRDGDFCDAVYITVNGVTHYPYFTIDANGNYSVNNATGLKKAINHWNALKVSGEKTITLAGGTYEVSDMVLWQNLTGKSLVIKAAENADVTLKPVASGNKSPYIFLVAGGSSYDATRAISFNGIKFDYTQAENVESAPVYCCPQKDSYVSQIEGINPTNDTRYAHNITFNNCSLSVFSAETENISFIAGPSAGSPKDVAFYNCTMTNGGYIHSGYINGIICEGCTVSGVKALINSQGKDGDYTITIKNNTIQARHDYIVRTSGGKVIVENNNITSTYSGDGDGAGVVVVRNSATEATFTGNTFTKSSASMWDCYCGCACTVNGEAKAAGTGINF